MSWQEEEVIQEFVLDQLSELGIDSDDCTVGFVPAKGRRRAQVILTFPEDIYCDVYEVLMPYLSELSDDFAYTFTNAATYKVCSASDGYCLIDDDVDESDELADMEALLESFEGSDVDDPDAQYAEEGLVITALDDDRIYCTIDEEDEEDD